MRSILLIVLLIAVSLSLMPTKTEGVAPIVAGAAVGVRVAAPYVRQAFVRYSTRKAAKEAAQRASANLQRASARIKPVSHGPHKPGYSPHYHQTGANGKPTKFETRGIPGTDRRYNVHTHYQFPRNKG